MNPRRPAPIPGRRPGRPVGSRTIHRAVSSADQAIAQATRRAIEAHRRLALGATDPLTPAQFYSRRSPITDPDAYAAASPYTKTSELDALIAAGLGNRERTSDGKLRRGPASLHPRYTVGQERTPL